MRPAAIHMKRGSFVDDCESGISMNCRCRKATLIASLIVSACIACFSNVSLVVKLGTNDSIASMYKQSMNVPVQQQQSHRNDVVLLSGMEDYDDDDDPKMDDASDIASKQPPTPPQGSSEQVDAVAEVVPKITKKSATMNSRRAAKTRRRRRQPDAHARHHAPVRPIQPLAESLSPDAKFSACLLVRDDNDILSEWIAYHYHTINLRHLIVAVDPLSSDSPGAIMEKWKFMTDLDIREWKDVDYMPADFLTTGRAPDEYMARENDFKKVVMSADSVLEISNHRYRQRVFLAGCMKALRASGISWVMHIVRILRTSCFTRASFLALNSFCSLFPPQDTDEYVVPSKLLRQMKPDYLKMPLMEEPGSVLSLLQQVVGKTGEMVNYPCISMLRLLFGSVEEIDDDGQDGVPVQYNATAFESLRWRYHGLPHQADIHGHPKVILDLRAIPERFFEDVVYSIHRPVREFCPKHVDLAYANYRKQPIALNHYLGSWERYAARNDKLRSRTSYDLKAAFSGGKDDGTRSWLRGFVKDIGPAVASKLLGEHYLSVTEPYSDSRGMS